MAETQTVQAETKVERYEAELRDAIGDLTTAIKEYDWSIVQDVVEWAQEALDRDDDA